MASYTWVTNINFTTKWCNFLKIVLLSLVLNILWDTVPIMRHHLPTDKGN